MPKLASRSWPTRRFRAVSTIEGQPQGWPLSLPLRNLFLPLHEKRLDRIRIHAARILKFSRHISKENFARWIENRDRRNALLNRRSIFLGQVEVLVVLPDIHMNHAVVLIDDFYDSPLMEPVVQYLAVEAPVASEDEDHPLVILLRLQQGRGNFFLGVCRRIVKFRVHLQGLLLSDEQRLK